MRALALAGNRIGDEGATLLAHALRPRAPMQTRRVVRREWEPEAPPTMLQVGLGTASFSVACAWLRMVATNAPSMQIVK